MRCRALGVFAVLSACSCGQSTQASGVFTPLAGVDGGYVILGSPCTLHSENDPSFGGFQVNEVTVESKPGQPLGAPVCIAFDFQGRVSCPYGQDLSADAGSGSCTTPSGQAVIVNVAPQCTNRRSGVAVVWSCACGAGAFR